MHVYDYVHAPLSHLFPLFLSATHLTINCAENGVNATALSRRPRRNTFSRQTISFLSKCSTHNKMRS